MPDTSDIPAHRATATMRSGDTQLIGEDGSVRNLDQEARDEAAAGEQLGAGDPPAEAIRPARRGAPDPLPPVQLTAPAGDEPNSSDA